MSDIQFTNNGGSIWGGGDLLEVYNTPTITLTLSVPLGYGGDGAFLGAKFTLALTVGSRFTLNGLAGGLDVDYGLDLPTRQAACSSTRRSGPIPRAIRSPTWGWGRPRRRAEPAILRSSSCSTTRPT